MKLRGKLSPEPIRTRYYREPVLANLTYIDISKDPFPTPQEAQIWFDLDGEIKSAFVPLRIVNEEKRAVTAALVGEREGKIVVDFPPTNFGHTRFAADEAALEKIAIAVFHPDER